MSSRQRVTKAFTICRIRLCIEDSYLTKQCKPTYKYLGFYIGLHKKTRNLLSLIKIECIPDILIYSLTFTCDCLINYRDFLIIHFYSYTGFFCASKGGIYLRLSVYPKIQVSYLLLSE